MTGLRARSAELTAENTALRDQVAELEAETTELAAHVAEQAEKIARLERLISRNSGNSSMPPSGDDLSGRTPPQLRPQSGQKRQPGAPGAHLEWSDHPDKTVPCFPQGSCACGADLAGARDLGARYSHQVTDLPEARAETTQYDRHEVQCSCGRVHVAAAPPEAAQPGTVA